MPFVKSERILLGLFTAMLAGGTFVWASKEFEDNRQRSNVKRTMANIRTIATAWDAYAEEHRQYNVAGGAWVIPGNPPSNLAHVVTVDELKRILTPEIYNQKRSPWLDGWGNELRFAIDAPFQRGAGLPANTYAIRSGGRNGTFDDPIVQGVRMSFDDDIVFSNGVFISY